MFFFRNIRSSLTRMSNISEDEEDTGEERADRNEVQLEESEDTKSDSEKCQNIETLTQPSDEEVTTAGEDISKQAVSEVPSKLVKQSPLKSQTTQADERSEKGELKGGFFSFLRAESTEVKREERSKSTIKSKSEETKQNENLESAPEVALENVFHIPTNTATKKDLSESIKLLSQTSQGPRTTNDHHGDMSQKVLENESSLSTRASNEDCETNPETVRKLEEDQEVHIIPSSTTSVLPIPLIIVDNLKISPEIPPHIPPKTQGSHTFVGETSRDESMKVSEKPPEIPPPKRSPKFPVPAIGTNNAEIAAFSDNPPQMPPPRLSLNILNLPEPIIEIMKGESDQSSGITSYMLPAKPGALKTSTKKSPELSPLRSPQADKSYMPLMGTQEEDRDTLESVSHIQSTNSRSLTVTIRNKFDQVINTSVRIRETSPRNLPESPRTRVPIIRIKKDEILEIFENSPETQQGSSKRLILIIDSREDESLGAKKREISPKIPKRLPNVSEERTVENESLKISEKDLKKSVRSPLLSPGSRIPKANRDENLEISKTPVRTRSPGSSGTRIPVIRTKKNELEKVSDRSKTPPRSPITSSGTGIPTPGRRREEKPEILERDATLPSTRTPLILNLGDDEPAAPYIGDPQFLVPVTVNTMLPCASNTDTHVTKVLDEHARSLRMKHDQSRELSPRKISSSQMYSKCSPKRTLNPLEATVHISQSGDSYNRGHAPLERSPRKDQVHSSRKRIASRGKSGDEHYGLASISQENRDRSIDPFNCDRSDYDNTLTRRNVRPNVGAELPFYISPEDMDLATFTDQFKKETNRLKESILKTQRESNRNRRWSPFTETTAPLETVPRQPEPTYEDLSGQPKHLEETSSRRLYEKEGRRTQYPRGSFISLHPREPEEFEILPQELPTQEVHERPVIPEIRPPANLEGQLDEAAAVDQSVQCPICTRMFPQSIIEAHASTCVEFS